jgi:hypothetical protein
MFRAPRLDSDEMVRLVILVAAVCASLCVVALLVTFLPGAHGVPVLPWLMFAMLFPVWGFTIYKVIQLTKSADSEQRQKLLRSWFSFRGVRPHRVAVAICCAVLLGWVVGLTSVLHIKGQPMFEGGSYFADNHGTHIPLTADGYEHEVLLQDRIFTAIPLCFFAASVGLLIASSQGPPQGESGDGVPSARDD